MFGYLTTVLNDVVEFTTRKEFIEWLIDYCEDNNRNSYNTRNILGQYSIRKNVEHHPMRIARELGFTVVVF